MADSVTTEPPKADLARLKKMFDEARDLTAQARLESVKDLDYYHTDQWTAAERAELLKRGQPDITINRVKVAVNGIVGVTERGRSEPRAYPRNPQDEDTSDVATDCLRYIADFNRFHRIKQDCFLDMLVPGSMAVLVGADADKQVTITQIRWEEFFHDPRSRRKDFADARYLGIAKWMYADDVKALYRDKSDDIEAAIIGGGNQAMDASFADRPEGAALWTDSRLRRLLVVELYYRDGSTWKRCVYHSAGVLDEGDSAYLDAKGRPDCPIVAESSYVKRDNSRYGVVRDMRGPQDEINKRRSKLLHLLSVSQIQAVDPSAIEVDVSAARAEAARPDGVIPFGWQKVQTTDVAAGQAQLLAEAKGEMERMGPNPAVVGRDNADASGRALQARTQAGLIELAPIYGALEDWELRVYRQCWARAKQYWTEPQFIRVTDDEDAPKFVGLNQMRGQPISDPNTGQMTEGDPVPHPLGGSVFGYKNVLGEMDVDITLDTTPDTANIQQEQFQDLMQLVGSNPAYAQSVPFETMLELSSVPHKRQLIDKLKKFREEAQQAQAQAQQQAMAMQAKELQIAEATAQANIGKTQAETDLTKVKAENETLAHPMAAFGLGVNSVATEQPEPAAGD